MFSNYLKIAFRNLVRHKGYAVINVLGLSVGFAACLIILSYVQFEKSFDEFHAKADRIHRIEREGRGATGIERWAYISRDMGAYLQNTFPEVEASTRLSRKDEPVVTLNENSFYETSFLFGEPSTFEMFDISMVNGNVDDLSRPGTVMLAASVAQKYFPSGNPIGQVLEVSNKWDLEAEQFEVVGVFNDLPPNSHFSVNFLGSMATVDETFADMSRQMCHTYVLLEEGASIESLNAKLASVDFAEEFGRMYENTPIHTIPLLSIHLYGTAKPSTDIQLQGDIQLVYLFSFIALLIIVLACINYMNLATARAAQRSREVGVRKVVGAARSQLFYQFIGESMIFVALALGGGVLLAQVSLPLFTNMLNQSFNLDWLNPEFVVAVVIGTILVGLIAGSYPAILLSGFQPSSVLKGRISARTWPSIRKGLVVFQFAVSIAFIAATFVIYQQLNYATSQRLGFDKEQKLVLMTRSRLGDKAQAFKDALMQQPGVKNVSMSSGIPGYPSAISFFSSSDIEGMEHDPDGFHAFDHLYVDYDYRETLGLNLIAGRQFAEDFTTDSDGAFMINATAAKSLGWDDPIGKVFHHNGKNKTVVGVVEDFHLRHVKEEVRPMLLEIVEASRYITLTLNTTDVGQSLAGLGGLWSEFIPSIPFHYSFMDDEVEALYQEELRLGILISLFSGLAVLVACLGLFGLAAYTSSQRTKEIGIRKILGASTSVLVRLLSADYLKLVCWAFIVATPIAYFTMQSWLDSFVYRVDLHWWVFVGAGIIALMIAVLAVSYQSIKTAFANPVNALGYE